ncbi:MAG TPA: asparagine synthase (glutamine-hydrolyzing) [Gaiellaceae bacterium]|nr:asparagine synthase (glutamine-hydrolyzing) [Gaiellaceae bacterium]
MCGIGAVLNLRGEPVDGLDRRLRLMNDLLRHRGPDGEGTWMHDRCHVGFAHRRLEIIDLQTGDQPMRDEPGNWITYNGEIYNYLELRDELGRDGFRTTSDTEVVLRSYGRWGSGALDRLRGMYAFAIWDEGAQRLVCARDRFGIKPLYYAVVDGTFVCASEAKALLPFLPAVETDLEGLRDYLTFQFTLAGKTLFKHVSELLPGHVLTVQNGVVQTQRYWEVHFEPDFDHTERYFVDRLRSIVDESVALHLRADVPVGSYLSGGLDSSIVASLAAHDVGGDFKAFTGRFSEGGDYDESMYARALAEWRQLELHETTIEARDFVENIRKVVYHLDYPVAGPGSFPQYMVSELARRHMKVVLGGQGGDEIFGGYARYLLAYFEQCIKAAIDGTMHNGNFIVTYESIIPNLETLREYKPLMQQFWREGLFSDLDERYFRLIDRAPGLRDVVDWSILGDYDPFETFRAIFRAGNVKKESYFDSMTHFDFKTLLPALLHVEDRVSMAHSLESRVPFVDHEVVEFAARLPADVKFRNGELKHALKRAAHGVLPPLILERKDKKGFPVPLGDWMHGELHDFIRDSFASDAARSRPYLDPRFDIDSLIAEEGKFSRNLWGLLSLELWQQEFHDRSRWWRLHSISEPAGEAATA